MKPYNRLRKKQKEAVLAWIAEGLETGEINERAKKFKPRFEVTKAQVDYYRSTREADLRALQASSNFDALSSGLAIKDERVRRLQQLADLMWRDITGGFLWLDQVKALGSGEYMQTYDYEEFNTAEVKEFRGVLDDIAKELGQRKTVLEVSWRDEAKRRGYDPDQLYRDMVNAARARAATRLGDGGGGGGSME